MSKRPYPQNFIFTLPFLVILPIRNVILLILKELSIALLNSRELDISSRFPRVSVSLSPSFFPKTTSGVIIVSTNELRINGTVAFPSLSHKMIIFVVSIVCEL